MTPKSVMVADCLNVSVNLSSLIGGTYNLRIDREISGLPRLKHVSVIIDKKHKLGHHTCITHDS